MEDYKVQLDTYSGPMDLLLYLIRREEVEIYDIPIAHILDQYLRYVRLLERLDPDAVGDFLVLAATLMEIKSRLLLPKPPPEVGEDDSLDPRADLVRQLLAYRSFREAAAYLDQRAELQARRFGRPPTDGVGDGQETDLEDVQIWDLLTAFNKLLAAVGQQRGPHEVIYDDTPISLHAADILDRLQREGPTMPFAEIFQGRKLAELIGLFLALLELIRQRRVKVNQDRPFGTIWVHLLDPTPITMVEMEGPGGGPGDAAAEAEVAGIPEGDHEAREAVIEPLLAEEEYADQEDEFTRRIGAVRVGEVDLGCPTRDGQGDAPADAPRARPARTGEVGAGEATGAQ